MNWGSDEDGGACTEGREVDGILGGVGEDTGVKGTRVEGRC